MLKDQERRRAYYATRYAAKRDGRSFGYVRADKPCEGCGGHIEAAGPTQRFCSQRCRDGARPPKIWTGEGKGWSRGKAFVDRRPCESCGAAFYAPPVLLRRGHGRFCSRTCRARAMTPSMFPKSGRGRGGKRADLENQYFRSTWEANWARYLNFLKAQGQVQEWAFEPDTFEFVGIKRGARFYTPDFKVTNSNGSVEYHEVKGWMDPRSATKLARMKRYHPKVKLVLIEKATYRSLKQKLGAVLPGWE